MHYWLADRAATQIEPGAKAVLLDQQDHVLEATSANILVHYKDEGLVTPPVEKVLPGISQCNPGKNINESMTAICIPSGRYVKY